MVELFQNQEVVVALLSGGVLVKLVDYLLPALLNKKRRETATELEEKENLRKDIEYLRGQIEELRIEIGGLREEITGKNQLVSKWQRKYWATKLENDRILLQVRHYGSQELKERINDTLREVEEVEEM